ncbi:MAG: peptidase S41 [Bacteroidetes bacterium]|nr:peptidase S41 [Bacteroidota bacterium]
MKISFYYFFLLVFLTGCGVAKQSYSPSKKYSKRQVENDYTLYREILEAQHPSLYWYTSKDSMNYFFDVGKSRLKDSMTEPEFRTVLNYVTAQIGCGHTTTRASKQFTKYLNKAPLGKIFPLSFKMWPDTAVVNANLNRKDSIFKRGTVIEKINGVATNVIIDSLFKYVSTDGYNTTHKYQRLSSFGSFGGTYTAVFGPFEKYTIDYIDEAGVQKSNTIPIFNAAADTIGRAASQQPKVLVHQPTRKERRLRDLSNNRLLKIDSVNKVAMMSLATFTKNYHLQKFFKTSFKTLNNNHISHLIIDVRNNGGGSVSNSTSLSRYLTDHSFKICDTLFSVKRKTPYHKYINGYFWNRLFMTLFTRKKADGKFHFSYFERHYFKPRAKNHYDGKVYVLTGGNSFSATTLFVTSVKNQKNVTVIGEETGGGAYGNSAWLIPEVTLPETGVRFRLPLFRMVINTDVPKNGRGIQPDVFSGPTVADVIRGTDYKLDKAMGLIEKDKDKKQ